MRLLAFLFLLANLSGAHAALAGDLRFPQTGLPAFAFHIPDSWDSKPDDAGGLMVEAPDRSAALTYSFITFSGTLDQLASDMIKGTAVGEAPKGISANFAGRTGEVFQSGLFNAIGIHMNVRLYLVRVDPDHVASCSLLTVDGLTDSQKAAIRSVFISTTLAGAPAR